MSHPARPIADRFWEKVDRSAGLDACWPFVGARSPLGYGRFHMPGNKSVPANRVAMLLSGTDPIGFDVLHSCDNPPCCNPAHLRLGTALDNARDAQLRGRAPIKTYKSPRLPVIECPRGHWMLGSNLYVHKDGRRSCVTCRRERTREYRARRAA